MKPTSASIIVCGAKEPLTVLYNSIYAYNSQARYNTGYPVTTYDKMPTNGNINNINPFINLIRSTKPSNAKIV